MESENTQTQSLEEPEIRRSEEILAVQRQVYDELQHFFFVPSSM